MGHLRPNSPNYKPQDMRYILQFLGALVSFSRRYPSSCRDPASALAQVIQPVATIGLSILSILSLRVLNPYT